MECMKDIIKIAIIIIYVRVVYLHNNITYRKMHLLNPIIT